MTNNRQDNKAPRVAIVLLNWNNFNDTNDCLKSLKNVMYPNYETIVIDNNSGDDSLQHLRKLRGIELIENSENSGFSGGVNIGINRALSRKTEYVLLLNNDTTVDAHFLTAMVRAMESDEKIGIVGSKILQMQPNNRIWSAGGKISGMTKRTSQYGQGAMDNSQFNQPRDVDFVSGCCMLIRREVFERIGTFDEDFFMYYEDVDFCVRAKAASYRVLYWPDAVIWHNASASSNRSFRDYYRMRNYIFILKKNYNYGIIKIFFLALFESQERIMRIFARKFIKKDKERLIERIISMLKGYIAGIISITNEKLAINKNA